MERLSIEIAKLLNQGYFLAMATIKGIDALIQKKRTSIHEKRARYYEGSY
ncbi:hypothetical protein [Siminovitchia fordii]|uniref:Uncharacterized protein n=1 Tax=Siminovitchia fordii TaxID=254759 RepID=A0ABQ4KAT7_9BACI|nr:hypothetical protein [Siminovitchia fordii]GIN22736.1 hypothetical protein J1TS3_38700 [Siminovitchia fordii]